MVGLLEILKDLVNNNAIAFMLVFALSFVANLLQVYSFLESRRQLREEAKEKADLKKLIETYEYLMNLAKENIRTEEELKQVQNELSSKTTAVEEISQRIKNLQTVARRALVEQAINQDITILLQKYENINKLRQQYQDLGDLPYIPEQQRADIENEVQVGIRRPYEFPPSFVFKAIVVITVIFLLPHPLSTIFTLAFLPIVLITIIEAIHLYGDPAVTQWITKFRVLIGAGSTIVLWISLVNYARGTFFSILSFAPNFSLLLFPFLGWFVGWIHWSLIQTDVTNALQNPDIAHNAPLTVKSISSFTRAFTVALIGVVGLFVLSILILGFAIWTTNQPSDWDEFIVSSPTPIVTATSPYPTLTPYLDISATPDE